MRNWREDMFRMVLLTRGSPNPLDLWEAKSGRGWRRIGTKRALVHRGRPRARARSDARPPWQGRQATGGWDGRLGMAPARTMAEVQAAAARWRALLRHQRPYGWAALVVGRGANAVSTPCQTGGCSPSLRPPPATSRSCGRDGKGRRSLERDPAPTRTRGPRDHLGLPTGNRQRRDRRGRPRQARSCDPSGRCARSVGGQKATPPAIPRGSGSRTANLVNRREQVRLYFSFARTCSQTS